MNLPKNLKKMFESTMLLCSVGANVDIGSIHDTFENTKAAIEQSGGKHAQTLIQNLDIAKDLTYIHACNNPRNVYPKKTI